MQRPRPREHGGELVGVEVGELVRVQVVAEALDQDVRRGEGVLEWDLLVEHHADEQRERVPVEQRVGRRVLGQAHRGCHGGQPARMRR